MDVFNLNADEWDRVEEREGWRSKDAWVGAKIGAELLGGSLYELEPGDRLWPYHTHHANEEWIIVLRGRPTLRTPRASRSCRRATSSASTWAGRAASGSERDREPIRVLMLSTLLAPDVVEYADSGKVSVDDAQGKRLFREFRGPVAEYWEGES